MIPSADIEKAFYSLPPAPWPSLQYLRSHGVSPTGLTEPDPPMGGRIIARSRTIFDFA